MKYKKTIVTTAVVLAVSIGSVAAMNNSQQPSTTSPVKKVATMTPVTTDNSISTPQADPTPVQPAAEAPVAQSTTPVAEADPTPVISSAEQNKTKLHDAIYAASKDIAYTISAQATNDQITNLSDIQWVCIDRLVSQNPGYSSYEALLSNKSVMMILNSVSNSKTVKYLSYFDGMGTCRVFNRAVN